MTNKLVSLYDLIKLKDDRELSEKYVRYIAGFTEDKQYRHVEIETIAKFISTFNIDSDLVSGFIYNYTVPQLNKEFDLIKVSEKTCINIELKSKKVEEEKIIKQLLQNKHYINMLNKSNNYYYTYISETNELYTLYENELLKCSIEDLIDKLVGLNSINIDLNQVFEPKNILVSPLNDCERFIHKQYLLTEDQENKKEQIISLIDNRNKKEPLFISLYGSAGTGKTLLLYDLANTINKNFKVQIIHSGILCVGHDKLRRNLSNISIIPIKDFTPEKNRNKVLIIDESHRLHKRSLNNIIKYVTANKGICIFGYDNKQILSHYEERSNTLYIIDNLCGNNSFSLTNKIRTNKELALFITCLRDMSKYRDEYKDKYPFNNVTIIYEPNQINAISRAKELEKIGYKYISYTPSKLNDDLDYQRTYDNTHKVIGQEFDKVCMVINDNFYYENNILKAKKHPNPDYIFEKLLYQGLTRVRSKLAIIITKKEILEKVLTMF